MEFSEEILNLFLGLGIAAGIGLLIGIEREFSYQNKDKTNELFAGIRTFPIIAILGFFVMMLGAELSYWVYGAGIFCVFVLIIISYYIEARQGDTGSTTQFSTALTFVLGGIVYLGYYELAVAAAVLTTLLLALKASLHLAVGKLSRNEIFAILQFVTITVLILPFLPDQTYGPYDVLNPREIWIIVIILVSINFGIYLIGRFLKDERSLLMAGIVGGLVSSTAFTWYVARHSHDDDHNARQMAIAGIIASGLMYPRMCLWLYIFNYTIFEMLVIPLGLLALISLILAYFLFKKHSGKELESQLPVENPLNLKDALKFAGIYVAILLVVGFSKENFSLGGVYAASGLSGLADVNAVTISLSKLAGSKLSTSVAMIGILTGALANTLSKYAICIGFGGRVFKRIITIGFATIFVGNLIILLFAILL